METDVVILRRSLDTRNRMTGIGAYTIMLKSVLESYDLESKDVFFKLTVDEGYLKCVTDGIIRPIHKLKNTDGRLYHATDEFCCVSYPFFKGKKITTFHHVFKEDEKEGRSSLLFRAWSKAAKNAVKYSDAIIAVSQQTRDELVDQLNVNPEKVFVLEHSADSFFKDLEIPRKKLIGFVGTLIERKNVAAGIRAFKSFVDMPGMEEYVLVICGEGHLKEDLISLVHSLGIEEKVVFISNISREDLRKLYNEMMVFINPSLHEGLGLTAIEARACGTPVVYFKGAEIPSVILKNYVPSDDEDDFAKNIYKLVTDADYRKAFAEPLAPRYSEEEYADKLFEIYSMVTGEEFP